MKHERLRGSIRVRVAAGAALIGLVVLSIGLFAFIAVARKQLVDAAFRDVQLAADQVVVALATGSTPEQLRLPARADGTQTRVLDEAGRVLALSPAVTQFERREDGSLVRLGLEIDPAGFPEGSDAIAARATAVDRFGRVLTVEASRSRDAVNAATAAMTRTGMMIAPIAILAIAAGAFRTSSRSLAPVLDITRHAVSIGDANRSRRVPVPEGDDEIVQLSHTLNEMLERFERARNREEALVSDVAHELRTPLTAIKTRLEHMRRFEADARSSEDLDDLLVQVAKLQLLVGSLLELSRLEATAGIGPEQRTVELLQLIEEVVADRADERIKLDGATITVEGDPEQLVRVLTNLLDNASRHAAAEMVVSLTREDGWAILTVDDDGPGIPHDRSEAVFERFVRLEESRSRDSGGAGLGLAIVRALVDRHGGRVRAGKSPLGGARFEVRLPSA